MKTHTKRPKRGSAQLAWDYFCEHYGSPQEMYYDPKVEFRDGEGPAWLAKDHDNHWHCVTNSSLKQWAKKQQTISASAPPLPQTPP